MAEVRHLYKQLACTISLLQSSIWEHVDANALVLFWSPALATPRYAGNTAADVDPPRVRASLEAIDAVFRDLPTIVGLPPDRVLFTVDGFRGGARKGDLFRSHAEGIY